MTRIILAAAFALGCAAPALADGHQLSSEQMAAIDALMESMRCEVAGEIEVEMDGDEMEIELDDVICAGGQFDMELNSDIHLTGARAE